MEVYIYYGDDTNFNPKDLSVEEMKELYKGSIDTYDLYQNLSVGSLSQETLSKIWTHIISKFEGIEVFGEKFSMSRIKGGKIYYKDLESNWRTDFSESGKVLPCIMGTKKLNYEGTVENISAVIIVHEWYSHGIKHTEEGKNHRFAYEDVIKSSFWENTTKDFKINNLLGLRRCTLKETGKDLNSQYLLLYKKYINTK